jgi:DNA-binding transcriptional MerR regulator
MSKAVFIGKVAKAAGISVDTIRYYEQLGLLPEAQRTESGYRVYSPDTVERLRFVRQAQALAFTLEEIKEILRLRYSGQSPCNCVRGMLEKKLEQVERQIVDLARFRRNLHKILENSRNIPRLPHTASALCPIIQIQSSRQKGTKAAEHRRKRDEKR